VVIFIFHLARDGLDVQVLVLLYLCTEHVADQLARCLHLRYRQGAEHLLPLTMCGYNSRLLQHGQVLRQVRFCHGELLLELRRRVRLLGHHIQNAQAGGVCEGLANLYLPLIDLIVDPGPVSSFHGS